AADNARSSLEESPGVLSHVFRRAQINISAFHHRGLAGVRHRAKRLAAYQGHFLDGLQNHLRTGGAINADRVGRPFGQLPGKVLGGCAIPKAPVILDRYVRDNYHLGTSRFAGSEDRFAKLIDLIERLEDERVDPCSY